MFDFVFSLRFLLLIFGALFVAGIYLWGGAKNRRNMKIKYAPRRVEFGPTKRRAGVYGATNTVSDNDIDTRSGPGFDHVRPAKVAPGQAGGGIPNNTDYFPRLRAPNFFLETNIRWGKIIKKGALKKL